MQEIKYPGNRTANIKAQPRSQRHPHLTVLSIRLSGVWLEELGFEPLPIGSAWYGYFCEWILGAVCCGGTMLRERITVPCICRKPLSARDGLLYRLSHCALLLPIDHKRDIDDKENYYS